MKPPPSLAAHGKGLDQNVIQRFALSQSATEFDRLLAQLGVGHLLIGRLERIDRLDLRLQPTDIARVRRAEQRSDDALDRSANATEEDADQFPTDVRGFPSRLKSRGEAPARTRSPSDASRGPVEIYEGAKFSSAEVYSCADRRSMPALAARQR